jgi:hypothetical protein
MYIDLLRISARLRRGINRRWDAPLAVFATVGLCAVHADSFAYSQSTNPALASNEIGERASVNPGNLTPTPVSAEAGNPFLAIPLRALSATRDRPLFSKSRRPAPAAAIPSPQQPIPAVQHVAPEAPPLILLGTIIGDKSRIGVFLNETLQTAKTIHEGEGASGWTLLSLHPRSAILVREGRIVTLEFPAPGSIAGAPIETAPGGPAGPVPRVSEYIRKQGWPALP